MKRAWLATLFLLLSFTPGMLRPVVAAEDSPIYLTADITPPERILFVKPVYPEEAKKDRIQGKVVIESVVGTQGDIEATKVMKSHPVFDESALTAVRQWKYKPALRNGKPVRVYITVIVDFDLGGDKK